MISLWQAMSFREPLWLLLALQPVLMWSVSRLLNMTRRDQVSDTHLRPWVMAQMQSAGLLPYLKIAFTLLGWLLLAMAMAGPRLPESMADQQTTTQRELMVLLDLSPSMSARDVPPNRLERAKLELLDLIQRMQGTRMGIIVYGAQPHLLSPMTNDKKVLRHYVNAIHARQLPTLGSRLDRALQFAAAQFDQTANTPHALLIVSDGEHHADNTAGLEPLATKLAQAGMRLYALGVGTAYGAPVMAEDEGWLQYKGQAVNSRLQSSFLQNLTRIGQGRYSYLHDSNLDWQQLYDDGIGRLRPASQTTESEQIIWQELYHAFLISGLICLLLSLWQFKLTTKSAALVLLVLLLPAPNQPALAADADYRTAYQQLNEKNYTAAKDMFRRLSGFNARMGEGSAAYRLEEYKAAAQQFTQAVLDATNDQQRGQALFNLANSRYQLNDYVAAATLYEDVLRYLPKHPGAKTNLEYARALQREETKSGRVAHRAGRGAQTGQAPEGMSTEGVRGMTLGDDEQQAFIPPDVLGTEVKTPDAIQQAAPASRKVDRDGDTDWQYRISSLEQLQQENPRIESRSADFWQRLYEQEEGFAAPLEQAHRLPGVKPW